LPLPRLSSTAIKRLCQSVSHQRQITPRDLVRLMPQPAACQMAGSGPALRPVRAHLRRRVAKIASCTATPTPERFLSEIVGAEAFSRAAYERMEGRSTNTAPAPGFLADSQRSFRKSATCRLTGGGVGVFFFSAWRWRWSVIPKVAHGDSRNWGTRLPARLALDSHYQDVPEAVFEREHLQRAIEIIPAAVRREAAGLVIPGAIARTRRPAAAGRGQLRL